MKTIAEQIADLLGNCGTNFTTTKGEAISLDDLARSRGAYVDYATLSYDEDGSPIATPLEDGGVPDLIRYTFRDGSAIVAASACWDIEGGEPWSFAGA